MSKNRIQNKALIISLLLMLASVTLFTAKNLPIKNVMAQQQGTTLKILPSQITAGEATQMFPTDPFTINITVTDVTGLYAWQIRIYYVPSILNLTSAVYPTGHVFYGKTFVEGIPLTRENITVTVENRTTVDLVDPSPTRWRTTTGEQREYNLTNWVDTDNSGGLTVSDLVTLEGPGNFPFFSVISIESVGSTIELSVRLAYVSWGLSLIGTQPKFDGSGQMAQLTFIGVGSGVSPMNFSSTGPGEDTRLLGEVDSTLQDIQFSVENSEATVLGEVPAGRESSDISMDVSANSVVVGSSITISGEITPQKPNVDVKISYKPSAGTWSELTTVKTDSNSRYTYTWATTEIDTFKLRASWAGDEDHLSAQSGEKTVTVTETGEEPADIMDYLPYILVAIIVVLAIVAVYFLKFKKP